MRRAWIAVLGAFSIAAGGAGSLVAAGSVTLDLSDFDADLMRQMDDTVRDLDSGIATRDAKAVATDARFIRESLQSAQDYFSRKGQLEDAVRWASQGQALADALAAAARAGDFETSLKKFDSLVKNCRACHDVYKPNDID
jgi:cytochrome c556